MAQSKKKRIATYDWADAARHCPELLVPACRWLASGYRGQPMLPFLLRVHVYDDGSVGGVHVCFRLTDRTMLDGEPLENDVRDQPFGKGPEAAAAAREYVGRKNKEIEQELREQAASHRKLTEAFGGRPSPRGRK